MAEFELGQFLSTIDNGDILEGDLILVNWDDVTEDFIVYKNGFVQASLTAFLAINSNCITVSGVSSFTAVDAVAAYSFCDGADLNWFGADLASAAFPYFSRRIDIDSPVCIVSGPVCDIYFKGPAVVTNATNISGNNGSIEVLALSSNGVVKYGLTNFDYSTEGQVSGLLENLAPNTYTVYAKDENGCTAQIEVTVLYKPSEAEHYRFKWQDVNGLRSSRLRLYERDYPGDVVEIERTDDVPFEFMKPKVLEGLNNKFVPIHPSKMVINLLSETDYQFLPLFTQDDRKFRGVYDVDEGSGFEIVLQGFGVPAVFEEDFVKPPYGGQFTISDGLKQLETLKFVDANGNVLNGDLKLIKIIAFILQKTGLELNIRSGINVFEINHNTAATDDPLDQTYINVACYQRKITDKEDADGIEPFKCSEVLEAILAPFGARVFQYDNCWILEEIDRAMEEYAYREFDYLGDYVSNSTFDPTVEIKGSSLTNRAAFFDEDQKLEILPAYSKIKVTSKLNYLGSIVSGGFEKKDLLSPEAEVELPESKGIFVSEEGFRDWSLRLNGTTGVSFGRVKTRAGSLRSVGAFFYQQNSWSGNLRDAYVESAAKDYQYGPGDDLKLSFEYSDSAPSEYPFIVLRYAVKLGSDWLQSDFDWDVAESIIRAYPKPSGTNSLQKFEVQIPLPETDVLVDTTIQVRIYFYAPGFYDFGYPPTTSSPSSGTDGDSAFQALDTDGVNYDIQVDVRKHYTIGVFDAYRRMFYQLRDSNSAESVPDIIRPDDYNGTTNPRVWWLMASINEGSGREYRTRGKYVKFLIDNVAVDSLPNGQEPPEEDEISYEISKYLTESLDVELYHFDLPEINNAKNMYNNYFKLSDGTPTSLWTRSGISEEKPIQLILLEILASNHSAPTFKISGSMFNEYGRIGTNNTLRYTKPGSSMTLSNTDFAATLTGWTQSGAGEAFVWDADNGGSAGVVLNGAEDSQKIKQTVSHNGGYIDVTVQVHAIPAVANDREDNLYVLFYKSGSIVHAERIKTFSVISAEGDYAIIHRAFCPSSIDAVGFFFKRVTGTGQCEYQVGEFLPDGVDVVEDYQISDFKFNDRDNEYFFELVQISKSYIDLSGIDTGGTGQDNSSDGIAQETDLSDLITKENEELILHE